MLAATSSGGDQLPASQEVTDALKAWRQADEHRLHPCLGRCPAAAARPDAPVGHGEPPHPHPPLESAGADLEAGDADLAELVLRWARS